jgi:hypothetical protein
MTKDKMQKLVDICFQLVLVSTSEPALCKKTDEEKANWVRANLNGCGFKVNEGCGCSWGTLTEVED